MRSDPLDGLTKTSCEDCGAVLYYGLDIDERYSHRCKPVTAKDVRKIIREELQRAANPTADNHGT